MKTAVYAFLDDKIALVIFIKSLHPVLESMGPEDDFTLDNYHHLIDALTLNYIY